MHGSADPPLFNMDTVQTKRDAIETLSDYIEGSLIMKSYDDRGCILKWLAENADPSDGTSNRREKFLCTKIEDNNLNPMKRRVEAESLVNNPQ